MNGRSISEIDIWTGVISPDDGDMPPHAAEAVLRWQFNDEGGWRNWRRAMVKDC